MPFVAAMLSRLALIIAMPFLLTHPKLRAGLAARFGFYRRPLPPKRQARIWVHGASAGDVLALLPTVVALRAQQGEVEVVASTITNSGHAIATAQGELFAAVVYAPLDLPGATRRALRALQPDVLVLEYTELWPNLIYAAQRCGVRLVLHNGRFSGARLRRYGWLFRAVGNLLAPLNLLLLRDEAEATRARALGADPARVQVTGNTKFDNLARDPASAKVAELRAAMALQADDWAWVAGSTHEGEEDLLLEVLQQLRGEFPRLRLLLAPRYVERADKVVALARRRGFAAHLRSRAPQLAAEARQGAAVVVLDSLGELGAAYALAHLTFVGGSFSARGGQNILEPAACGKVVLFGPNMENFADSVQVLLGRGGLQVADAAQLRRVMAQLLRHPERCAELGQTGRRQVRAVRGAAARNAKLIDGLLRT